MKRQRLVRAKRFESLNAMRAMCMLGGELSAKARQVYFVMILRAWPWPDDPKTARSHMGPKRLAVETGLSSISVSRAWVELERAGWIARTGAFTDQGTIIWRVHAAPVDVEQLPQRGKRMRADVETPDAAPPPSEGRPPSVQGTGVGRSQRRMPGWLLAAANDAGIGARALADMAVDVCRRVLDRPDYGFDDVVSDARQIVTFWEELQHPPLEDLRRDLLLMADAFRGCSADLFAKQIRNEDGRGVSRVNSVARLVRADDWTVRLDLARAWDARGRAEARASGRRGSKGQQMLQALRDRGDVVDGQ